MEHLFEKWAGEKCLKCEPISAHGSARTYFRLKGNTHTCIASKNLDVRENQAFIYYSHFFKKQGINVPEIFAISDNQTLYLQQDLGDQTLYNSLLDKKQQSKNFDTETENTYKKVLENLVKIQKLGKDIDFSYAYPRSTFDQQSMFWDLNYFKYDFLKIAHIPFDEQLLETDFQNFVADLDSYDKQYFLYRDFQSRNIMLHDNKIYFIDYQGGRRGCLYYDLASLLYDAKAEIPEENRKKLLKYYYSLVAKDIKQTETEFQQTFNKFVLLRIMQAMGTYGYRGLYEQKLHFVKSIAPAQKNLENLLQDANLLSEKPELKRVLQYIIQSQALKTEAEQAVEKEKLTVSVNSFSFKRGYPLNNTGNWGGFVFDCRALPNPGRYPQYKTFTGKDQPVIDFLKDEPDVLEFLTNVQKIIMQSVKKYTQRGFTNLQVNFGCTGGQHRSVYCAEQIATFLQQNTNCIVEIHHIEQDKK